MNSQFYKLMYETEMLKRYPAYGGLRRQVETSTTGAR